MARAKEFVEGLVASERKEVVRYPDSEEEVKSDWKPLEKFVRGQLKELVPEGMEFAPRSERWSPCEVTMALLPTDSWLSTDPEPFLAGNKHVGKYHSIATVFAKTTETSSKDVERRMKLLLHVLFTEAEARGWTVEKKHTGGYTWQPEKDIMVISAGNSSFEVKVKEKFRKVERPPTKKETEDHERSLQYSWNRGRQMPTYYDRVGTGLITIMVGDMTRNDTDAKPTRLNNLMPSILTDIHRRIQWNAIDEERKRLAAERRARRYAKATELARAHYQEKERYKILLKRASEWKERLVVMEGLLGARRRPRGC